MSQQEANANAGEVDTVNTTGVTLTSVNVRGYIEGSSIYVREKSTYYILEFNQSNVIDHNLYETANGIAGAQWIKFVGGGGSSTVQLTGDVTAGPGLSPVATTIAAKAITLSKFQDIATASVLGRSTAGSGAPEVLTLSAGLSIISGVLTNTAPFGTNTTLTLLNSAAAAVPAWQHIVTLPTSTAGSEKSQADIYLLDGTAAAHQSIAFSIRPYQVTSQLNPTPTTSTPNYAFSGSAAALASGMFYDATGGSGSAPSIKFCVNGSTGGGAPHMSISQNGDMAIFGSAKMIMGVSADATIGRNNSVGGITLNTTQGGAGELIQLQINGSPGLTVTHTKSVLIGSAAVATTATDGFLYVTACAGPPTGVPTAVTGRVPFVVDSTNGKAYIYVNSAWAALN